MCVSIYIYVRTHTHIYTYNSIFIHETRKKNKLSRASQRRVNVTNLYCIQKRSVYLHTCSPKHTGTLYTLLNCVNPLFFFLSAHHKHIVRAFVYLYRSIYFKNHHPSFVLCFFPLKSLVKAYVITLPLCARLKKRRGNLLNTILQSSSRRSN